MPDTWMMPNTKKSKLNTNTEKGFGMQLGGAAVGVSCFLATWFHGACAWGAGTCSLWPHLGILALLWRPDFEDGATNYVTWQTSLLTLLVWARNTSVARRQIMRPALRGRQIQNELGLPA